MNFELISPSSSPVPSQWESFGTTFVVYDAKNPAPAALQQSWLRFQKGDRPIISGR
ncbi:hypothetical protein [Nostoc sp.]|uniref:hypothetical protein n=1 Tax=Nostoc sp. TaxID=1180 RepID=UPI002FFC1351